MTRFLAISGKKQSGKDSVATHIANRLARQSVPVAITHFARPLKDMINSVFGIPSELLYGTDQQKDTETYLKWEDIAEEIRKSNSKDSWGGGFKIPVPRSGFMTVREVLQVVGTDIFRKQIKDTVWAEVPFRKDWGRIELVIIPDCRFPNEIEVLRQNDGNALRIVRPGILTDGHSSETALDNYEFNRNDVIVNDSTLDALLDRAYDRTMQLYPDLVRN